MNVQPVTLTGQTIRLEPAGQHHAADLAQAADAGIFVHHFIQPQVSEAGFADYITLMTARPATIMFAQVLLATGRAIGTTTYMEIQPSNRGLEIGSTWISRAHQGTTVNPEAKYLLMRHAFETLGAIRVQLKTDLRNTQSQRAIEKLGAVKEGVLRQHIIMPDGYIRDTVMYSITDAEWPTVKARLESRLEI